MSITILLVGFAAGLALLAAARPLAAKLGTTVQRQKKTAKTVRVVGLLLTYGTAIGLLLAWMAHTPGRAFNQASWLADTQHRYQMADDLLKRQLLAGKDSQQVKQLLGEPDRTTFQDSTAYRYEMGAGAGALGIEFHSLLIRFRSGRVAAVEHVRIRD